jgi:hypothetical protein
VATSGEFLAAAVKMHAAQVEPEVGPVANRLGQLAKSLPQISRHARIQIFLSLLLKFH